MTLRRAMPSGVYSPDQVAGAVMAERRAGRGVALYLREPVTLSDEEAHCRARLFAEARQGHAAAIKELWVRYRCWIVTSPPAPELAHGV